MRKDLMPYRPEGDGESPVVARLWALPPDYCPILPRARMGAGSSFGLFSGWIPILANQFGSSAHPGANHFLPAFRWVRLKAGFHTGYFPPPIRAKTDLIQSKNQTSIPYLWGPVLRNQYFQSTKNEARSPKHLVLRFLFNHRLLVHIWMVTLHKHFWLRKFCKPKLPVQPVGVAGGQHPTPQSLHL